MTDPLPPVEAILRRCTKDKVGVCLFNWIAGCRHAVAVLSFAINNFNAVRPSVDNRRHRLFQVMLLYNVPDFKDCTEFLVVLAQKMGRLKKGGVPDTNRAARKILQDWNTCVN